MTSRPNWTRESAIASNNAALILANISSHISNRVSDITLDASQSLDANHADVQIAGLAEARRIVESLELQADPSNVMDIAY